MIQLLGTEFHAIQDICPVYRGSYNTFCLLYVVTYSTFVLYKFSV